jgi:hypothetical protein
MDPFPEEFNFTVEMTDFSESHIGLDRKTGDATGYVDPPDASPLESSKLLESI